MPYKDENIRREKHRIYYLKNRDIFIERSKLRFEAKKEEILEQNKLRYKKDKKRILAVNKLYRIKHKAEKALMDKNYYLKNIDRIKKYKSDWDKKWRATHKGEKNANTAKRFAALMKRIPKYANLEKIKEIYKEAERLTKSTGIQYQVDHIIPLQGKTVSGFHHENNLRIITAQENMSKGNRFTPMFIERT